MARGLVEPSDARFEGIYPGKTWSATTPAREKWDTTGWSIRGASHEIQGCQGVRHRRHRQAKRTTHKTKGQVTNQKLFLKLFREQPSGGLLQQPPPPASGCQPSHE